MLRLLTDGGVVDTLGRLQFTSVDYCNSLLAGAPQYQLDQKSPQIFWEGHSPLSTPYPSRGRPGPIALIT